MGTLIDTRTGEPREPKRPVPSLEIEDPSSGHRTVRLEKDTTRLGRSADNEIQILVSHVSKHHAEIRRDGDRFTVADAGSKAGVFVNGNSCEERALKDGDIITFGPMPPPKIVFRTGPMVPQVASLSSGTSLIMSLTESTGPEGLEKLSKFLVALPVRRIRSGFVLCEALPSADHAIAPEARRISSCGRRFGHRSLRGKYPRSEWHPKWSSCNG